MREQNLNIIFMIERWIIDTLLFLETFFGFSRAKANQSKSYLLDVEGSDSLIIHGTVSTKPIGHPFIVIKLIDDEVEHDGIYHQLIECRRSFSVNPSLRRCLDSFSVISDFRAEANKPRI